MGYRASVVAYFQVRIRYITGLKCGDPQTSIDVTTVVRCDIIVDHVSGPYYDSTKHFLLH